MPQLKVNSPVHAVPQALVGFIALAALLASASHLPAAPARAASVPAPDGGVSAALRELVPLGASVAAAEGVPFGGNSEWQVGTVTLPAATPGAGDDEPRVFLYLAERDGSDWKAVLQESDRFASVAARAAQGLRGTPAAQLVDAATDVGDGSALLSLPWPVGDTWRLTGGPHPFYGGNVGVRSSLDFAGPRPGVPVPVLAARDGIVVRPCANLVQVHHAGGWATSYYHLGEIAVEAGDYVERGELLGYTSTRAGCGGSATGAHVHFSLLKHGSYVDLADHAIGGWTIDEGRSAYRGCLRKRERKTCAPAGFVLNDGSIGASPPPVPPPPHIVGVYVE